MKAKALLLVIVMGLYGMVFADTMQDRRCAWWQNHQRLLVLEREKIGNKDNTDPAIMAYLDREISRTEKMIAVFRGTLDKKGDGDSSPTQIDASDLDRSVEMTLRPLVSLRLLKEATMEIDSAPLVPAVKAMVKERFTAMARSLFIEDTDELVQVLMNSRISREDWKILAGEVLLGSIDLGRGEMIGAVKRKVMEELTGGGSDPDKAITAEKLNACALKHAALHEGIKPDPKALDDSWRWRQIHYRVERELQSYGEIRDMAPRGKDLPLAKIQYYYRNPAALDALVFSIPAGTTPGENPLVPEPAAIIPENPVTLTVPTLPDAALICREMDSRRQKALAYLRNKNDEAYVTGLNEEFEKIIITHTARCNNIFLHEEKRIKDNAYRRENIVNFNAFEKAKNDFRNQMQICYDYKTRSRDFLDRVVQWHDLSRPRIMELLDYQMNRGGRYMTVVTNLVRDCATLYRLNERGVHADFTVSIKRIDGLSRFAMKGISFDREMLLALQAGEIRSLKPKQIDASSAVKAGRHEAGTLYNEYMKNRDAAARSEKSMDSREKNLAAQFEVDTVTAALKDCRESFSSLRYAQEALARYRIAFDALHREALAGKITPELGRALDSGTLIPGIEGLDSGALEREMRARYYFMRRTRTELARLVSVLQYYRHADMTVEGYPTADEMTETELLLQKRPSVKIASWDMNESNFAMVDRKAVAFLSQTMKRGLYRPESEDENEKGDSVPTSTAVTVSLDQGSVSLAIPAGWIEATPEKKITGILRQYAGMDRETSISLASLPLGDKNLRDVSEQWLMGRGIKPVRERWGSQDGSEYYWILARDRNNRITECYVVKKDEQAFIVEGNTTRNKYTLFSPKLGDVFRSMK